jgi:site-specific DNA recombinase
MQSQSSGPERAALYPRVSTAGQEEDGTSLTTQEQAMRRYAAEHGYAVDEAHVYPEVFSGAKLRERPQLARLREAVRRREVDVVLCYALDRLSRDQAHTAILVDEFEHHGCRLELVTETFEDTATGRFIRSAKAFAAEIEREKIVERTVRGRRARVEAGKLLPGCRPRYGYRFTEGKAAYEEDVVTGAVMRRIWRLAVRGTPVRAIAAELTRDGIKTPSGLAVWSHTTVRQLLHDPIYTGDATAWRWAKDRESASGKRIVRQRDPAEHVALPEGTVPALVSEADFKAVQVRLQLNQLQASRNNRAPHETLLRGGYVHCGRCGYAMQVRRQVTGRGRAPALVYCCPRRAQGDTKRCGFNIRATILDDAVWSRVARLLREPELIAAELERMRSADPTAVDLAATERALTRVARQQRNLVEQLANVSGAVAELVTQKLAALEGQRQQLEREREDVLGQRAAWEAAQARFDEVEAWCATVAGNLPALTYDERRRALDALNVRVKLWPTGHAPRYEVKASVRLDSAAAIASSDIPRAIPGGNCEMNSRRLFQGSTT